jgi:hypothetical protein
LEDPKNREATMMPNVESTIPSKKGKDFEEPLGKIKIATPNQTNSEAPRNKGLT